MSGTIQPQHGREAPEQALARAQAAAQAKRFGEAGGICNDVLAGAPEHPSALALLGIVHAHRGDVERAIELLERAVRRQEGVAAWHANLCSLYRITNRTEAALAAGREAVRLAPDSADNLVNLSLVLTDVDDRERAMSCLLRAIGLNDQHADAHLALAQTLLAQGEMDPGWVEYEWRNQTEAGRGQLPRITSAPWTGMRIPGGKILLIGDQGYGDTIQFARFIPMVAERCEEVLLGCSAEMAPLLARVPGVSHSFHRWNEIPGHAAYCRLSSLALIFHTTLETIPNRVPYLTPDPARVDRWASWLQANHPSGTLRIGLAWSGRPSHPNDRRRSLRLDQLAPIASAGPARFISLQKPLPPHDAARFAHFPGLVDLSGELSEFDDTAALVANLDLVITVDTSIGHLSGALGKPTWIMLPKASDWRWLLQRSDSPWYPNVRLFRQHAPGAWDSVISDVAAALSEVLQRETTEAAT
jgi:ADP-heptose:LPS heptosyltransferase/Tfp pilus assembly protein PilF